MGVMRDEDDTGGEPHGEDSVILDQEKENPMNTMKRLTGGANKPNIPRKSWYNGVSMKNGSNVAWQVLRGERLQRGGHGIGRAERTVHMLTHGEDIISRISSAGSKRTRLASKDRR